jgi:hypothetical protein
LITRQGPQKYRIHHGKHGRVGADPKRKRDHSGHCERWATPQSPSSNTQVGSHGLSPHVGAILRPGSHLAFPLTFVY